MIEPREVIAELGDYIEWQFWSGTHQISRGDFDHPCSPYEDFHMDRQGFSSGEKVVETPGQDPLIFRLQVNESEPMFFYSGSNDDCSKHKMVVVINPAEGKNLRLWNHRAWNFTVQAREESRDDESSGVLYSRSCGDGDFILGAGQVVGIALGGAAAILIAGLLGFFCHRHSVERPVTSRHIRRSSYPVHYQSKYTDPVNRPHRPSRAAAPRGSPSETGIRRGWSNSLRRHKKTNVPRQPRDTRQLPSIPSQPPASALVARNMSRPVASHPIHEDTRLGNSTREAEACDGSAEIPVVFSPPSPVELPSQSRDWLSTYFRPTSVSLGLALSPNSNRQLSWSGNEALQRPSPV